MHPRNPFRMKPNFADLASRHLDLAEHVQTTSKGKSRIDFECAEAVRALTRVLLLEAFELNVKFDSERLVPAVPQRMNYLLWIQDIYRTAGCGQPWTGLDLGTGACSILPLLGCRIEPNWSFVASEVDARSACNATANIYTNHLESRISGNIFALKCYHFF